MIPAEAVEAAAKALFGANSLGFSWEELNAEARERYRDLARVALEAAAPHMQPDDDSCCCGVCGL